MIKDITLGQFFPGESVLHRIDPRMKIMISILFITMIFGATTVWSLLLVTVITFLMPLVAKIPMETIFKAIKPLRFIVIIMFILFALNGKGPADEPLYEALWSWNFIYISWGGLIKAVSVSLRIIVLVVSVSVILSYTTSPIALADGIEELLAPLKVIKVPVHDFAMMITIAMRFIPILVEETDKIMSAQSARGADFKSGSLIKRAKALIPVFIPLFVSSVRHADNLATAMECRCYHGGDGRTRMKKLSYTALDFAAFFVMSLLLVGVALLTFEVGGFTYA